MAVLAVCDLRWLIFDESFISGVLLYHEVLLNCSLPQLWHVKSIIIIIASHFIGAIFDVTWNAHFL